MKSCHLHLQESMEWDLSRDQYKTFSSFLHTERKGKRKFRNCCKSVCCKNSHILSALGLSVFLGNYSFFCLVLFLNRANNNFLICLLWNLILKYQSILNQDMCTRKAAALNSDRTRQKIKRIHSDDTISLICHRLEYLHKEKEGEVIFYTLIPFQRSRDCSLDFISLIIFPHFRYLLSSI